MTMIDRDRQPTGPDDIPGLLLKGPRFEQTGVIDGVLNQIRDESATVVDAAPVPPLLYGDDGPLLPRHDDPVNHPAHYTGHPSGIECIQVTEHMDFLLGNAIKYLWRAPNKADITEQIIDLEKARWYIERKVALLQATP